MEIVVQKFGGSSVANNERLTNVCSKIIKEHNFGKKIVVVVSAQGKTTDGLVRESRELSDTPSGRELDVLLSTGEQITIAKLCIKLNEMGYKAISYTGWQLPILTDNIHGEAKIKNINNQKIIEKLEEDYIVVIAGFQGMDENGDITTLGRGGSDTTAVAIAASIKAVRCDIYTDVDGIYSGDPRVIDGVLKIDKISYDEMLELASLGAKVLHNRCVEIGRNYNIPILVKSSFNNNDGTIVGGDKVEELLITGVAKDDNVVRITLMGIENKIGKTYEVFDLLAKNNINVDIIIQSFGEHVMKTLSFTVAKSNLKETLLILEENKNSIEVKEIQHDDELSKISIVGVGMVNNPGVASKVFEALYENNINIHMISTSEIKISVVVNRKDADAGIKAIHDKFF